MRYCGANCYEDCAPMPWEKSFDEDTAVAQAMAVFWQKGFESTSIADLIEQTGINRGSLYNAFGGKRSLFLQALRRYDQDRQAMLARLEALDDPVAAIREFFDSTVANTVSDRERKGCFLFNTALEIRSHDDAVRDLVTNGVREIDAFFRRSIEVGQARGEIPATQDAMSAAKSLVASTVAIRVLGRGVFDEDALQALAEQARQSIT